MSTSNDRAISVWMFLRNWGEDHVTLANVIYLMVRWMHFSSDDMYISYGDVFLKCPGTIDVELVVVDPTFGIRTKYTN